MVYISAFWWCCDGTTCLVMSLELLTIKYQRLVMRNRVLCCCFLKYENQLVAAAKIEKKITFKRGPTRSRIRAPWEPGEQNWRAVESFCIRGATRRPWFQKRSAHLRRERTDYAEGRGGIKIKQQPREWNDICRGYAVGKWQRSWEQAQSQHKTITPPLCEYTIHSWQHISK